MHHRPQSQEMTANALSLPVTTLTLSLTSESVTTTTGMSADGLRIKRLSVPESVANGSSVQLTCDFDLQGETLYSVRWYKNYVEFYRFLPSNVPTPAHSSHLTGAVVDVSRSLPLVSSFAESELSVSVVQGTPFEL